jgi:hypothetical protein
VLMKEEVGLFAGGEDVDEENCKQSRNSAENG